MSQRLLALATAILLFPTLATAQSSRPTSQPTSKPVKSAKAFANAVEAAHGVKAWRSKKVVSTEIQVKFGGKLRIDGKMYMETHSSRTRIELKNGTVLVFDGKKAWVSGNTAFPGARFHLLTWSYFLAAPFKLQDPGSKLADMGPQPLDKDRKLNAAKLTFGAGVGDTPDDWYICYQNNSKQLKALAYIVTYGKSAEKAGKEPHAVVYNKFQLVEGVKLSTKWFFYNWNAKSGIFGDAIGEVTLKNIKFHSANEALFQKPEKATEDKLPGSQ